VPRNRTEPSGFAIRYAHPAPHVIRAGEGNRTHLSCLASTCLNRSATPAWSGYSGSNRAMHSLEGWPLTKRIPASMAVPTDTAEAGAFGTAGAGFESRTRLRNVPGSVASEDEPALVDPWGNAPHRSACKAKQRPFASEPKRFAGCWRIERHPADLESTWPPWPAPHSAP
jgi:hypothetical protein